MAAALVMRALLLLALLLTACGPAYYVPTQPPTCWHVGPGTYECVDDFGAHYWWRDGYRYHRMPPYRRRYR